MDSGAVKSLFGRGHTHEFSIIGTLLNAEFLFLKTLER